MELFSRPRRADFVFLGCTEEKIRYETVWHAAFPDVACSRTGVQGKNRVHQGKIIFRIGEINAKQRNITRKAHFFEEKFGTMK